MSTATPRWHHQPRVELRVAQPYVGITARAESPAAFRAAVDRDVPAVLRWLAARAMVPAGPPFLRYLVVDEQAAGDEGPPPSTFQSCVPVASGSGRTPIPARPEVRAVPGVQGGELPAGTWLVTLHRGGYSGLARAHDLTYAWATEEGVVVDRRPAADGTAFAGAVEHFRIGRAQQPDPWRWETDVAYLLVPPAPPPPVGGTPPTPGAPAP